MSTYQTKKNQLKKRYSEKENWDFIEEGLLNKTRSACVCITCQHFEHYCDKNYRTMLTCQVQQRLIPHGGHLTSRCPLWMKRIGEKISCSPEPT